MRLIVIGAGPGGYETAVAAARAGAEVTLVSDGPVGGTCLNEGCIPTKTLCRSAQLLDDLAKAEGLGVYDLDYRFDFQRVMARKEEVVGQLRSGVEFLLKDPHINLLYGKASLTGPHSVRIQAADGSELAAEGDYILLATGSVSASLPIPGAGLDGVLDSRGMLSLQEVPKRLCVIGAGVIGLEFASIFKSFGSDVTVLEYAKEILPRFDTDLAKRLKQTLVKRGISIETSAAVQAIEQDGDAFAVRYLKKDAAQQVTADKVLMAVGRRPALGSLNLEEAGIAFTPRGVTVDAHMRTSVPSVFAIGDLIGGWMLAHAATFQGRVALAEMLRESGGAVPAETFDLDLVPAAVFTRPEAACVGLSEEACKEKGIPVKGLKSLFRANGKALAMDEPEGWCKILIYTGEDQGPYVHGQVLGAHLLGAHSADLIHELTALMNRKGTLQDLRNIIHAHPTLSEVLQIAAYSA